MLHLNQFIWYFNSILAARYDDVFEQIDVGRLFAYANHCLLSQDESNFNECHKVLVEIFTHPIVVVNYSDKGEETSETKSLVTNMYNSQVRGIVKSITLWI
ncbi:hypothetical protein RF11_15022 [Thelohanellus kitauei]|uniref:Uncharacterized protein n=1 Tax=Thelohanellus kitauei TaxID=669202 RepID=A0A0C2MMR8_THEKT|nr:hypothetical protein RF11_12146 [Thelohanellus kitauei]KII63787.1 hypothetical protein RF11_15022 [Thelohanellus kitauei]